MKFGGLKLQKPSEVANIELLNSMEITTELYKNIITPSKDFQLTVKKRKPTKIS